MEQKEYLGKTGLQVVIDQINNNTTNIDKISGALSEKLNSAPDSVNDLIDGNNKISKVYLAGVLSAEDVSSAGTNITISGKTISSINTTYKLSKSGNTIYLTASDGTKSSVVDAKNESLTLADGASIKSLSVSGAITGGTTINIGSGNTVGANTMSGAFGYSNTVSADVQPNGRKVERVYLFGDRNVAKPTSVDGYIPSDSMAVGEINELHSAQAFAAGRANIIGGDVKALIWGEDSIVTSSTSTAYHAYGAAAFGYTNRVYGRCSLLTGNNNEAYGAYCFICGDANKSPIDANGVFISGYNNVNAANNSLCTGVNNILTPTSKHTLVFGSGNRSAGTQSIIGGQNVNSTATQAIVVGQDLVCSGNQNALFGYSSQILDGGKFNLSIGNLNVIKASTIVNPETGEESSTPTHGSIAVGYNNVISGGNGENAAFGANNQILPFPDENGNPIAHIGQAFVAGHTNIAASGETAVFGKYNKSTHHVAFVAGMNNIASRNGQAVFGYGCKQDADALFIIGNGLSFDERYQDNYCDQPEHEDRSNAFVIKGNGNIWCQGKATAGADPEDAMDLVTKQYMENTASALESRINQLESLLTTLSNELDEIIQEQDKLINN